MLRCETCGGEGTVDIMCSTCNGSGEGMYDGSRCYTCRGVGGWVDQTCPACDGEGAIEETC